jgi:hypothetical protein
MTGVWDTVFTSKSGKLQLINTSLCRITLGSGWPPVLSVVIGATVLACLTSEIALADNGAPILRSGKDCPLGYRKSNEYCIPRTGSKDTPQAIERVGSCPPGFRKSGDYCVVRAGQTNTPHLIQKRGSCPSGYRASGQYCIGRGN